MYQASANFITAVKSKVRKFNWSGEINTDTPIEIEKENILSGSITRKISENKLNIGTVYTSQLTMTLSLDDVSRYEIYGKEITLFCSIVGASDEIPMGIYIIDKPTQTANQIIIKGYDYMTKFGDVNYTPKGDITVKTPYTWLSEACTACGVTLGMTEAQVKALPNGERKTGIADVVSDIKTWRDVLSYMATYLGSYVYIGRDGKLYLGTYGSTVVDTIASTFRYSSDLSDYKTTYNGINHVYKEGGIQEYTDNENEDGLVLDIGTNPFLQFTDDDNRMDALQAIIDLWNDVYYVPFNVTMPLVPYYDVGDVVKFSEKQATNDDIGAITEITYDVNGDMTIKCTGDNPRLASAQDRYTKAIAGLNYTNGQEIGSKEFWIIGMTNSEQITVGSTEIQVAEIEYNQSTYGQEIAMVVTIDATLSATAIVSVRVTVDDDVDLEMEVVEKRFKGERGFYCSNNQQIFGIGTHQCKVYMTVTDSATKVGELY